MRGRAATLLEVGLASTFAALVFVVHDVPTILHRSFWLDEAWVADSTRVPFFHIGSVTSSSPVGWTAALRLMAIGGPQRYRLLPLLLLAATVVLAYLIGRRSGLPRPLGGSLAALAVLLLPHALVRNDLKQYTSDAFFALLILWLTARAERTPDIRRLSTLAVIVVVAPLFSQTALLVGPVAVVSLVLATLLRRDRRALLRVIAAGLLAAVGVLLTYALAIRPKISPSLRDYWRHYFIPTNGIGPAWHYIVSRTQGLQHFTNLGPFWLMTLILIAGVVALAWRREIATALALPLVMVAMIVASARHRYPLLDQHTSFFVFVIMAVVAVFGVAGVARLLVAAGGRLPLTSDRARTWVGTVAAGALILAAVGAYAVVPLSDYLRPKTIPSEDTKSATSWVDGVMRPGDVLVVDGFASFGYAYYTRRISPSFGPDRSLGTDFVLMSQPSRGLIVVGDNPQDAPDMRQGVARARALVGSGGLIYVLLSHSRPATWAAVQRLSPLRQRRWSGAYVDVLAASAPPAG